MERRMFGDIPPFHHGPEPIDDCRFVAKRGEFALQIRADETGPARDQDHEY
jgi:hypothetical protein